MTLYHGRNRERLPTGTNLAPKPGIDVRGDTRDNRSGDVELRRCGNLDLPYPVHLSAVIMHRDAILDRIR